MENSDRVQHILDAAAELIIQFGYDKTTIGDVADAVGISRPLVYIHFKSKEALLEALIVREMLKYGNLWLNYIETDPQGGTVGSVYRSILKALQQTPLLAAIVTRSEGTFGKYLRRPDNIFKSMQTPMLMRDLLAVMQDKGAIRKDVDIDAMAYIMDALSASFASGWSKLEQFDFPDTVYPLNSVPHTWLFPQVAAVIHHGGAGTTAAGLRAGKPTLICPFLGDQPFWGKRVYDLGVGAKPIPQSKLRADNLAQAIDTMLNDAAMQERASVLGEKIRSEAGIACAEQVIRAILRG